MSHRHLPAAPALAAAALVLGLGGDVLAADPPQSQATAPAESAPPAVPAPAKAVAKPAAADAASPAAPAKPGEAKGSPLHFEPTEKTRADFEVSFPTDI